MSRVKWNGPAIDLAMRTAVASGLSAVADRAAAIVSDKMPPAVVKTRVRTTKRTPASPPTLYATPSSPPTGYPARRVGDLERSIQFRKATADQMTAAFGVFGGKSGVAKFEVGKGGAGYPLYLETRPITKGGRRWANRTITENRSVLNQTFTTIAIRDFARAIPSN